ncbi:DUF5706 domain-containing protein [Streptomyces sp. NBC_01525]|uniref:Pycsar system effector family protein n=1 Tax=Streptomyces sp. NBC_01525 TaxID=2903893 RepID=UPI003866E644
MSYQDPALAAAHAEVKAELARTDTKASLLLAFNGALTAGVWTVATRLHLNLPAMAVGIGGAAALLTSCAVLLSTTRPNLGGRHRSPSGFPLWATLTPDTLLTAVAEEHRAAHVVALSKIAVAKFARLQRAIDLTRGAGAAFVLAAVLAWVGEVAA